jgi:hypothetical protein
MRDDSKKLEAFGRMVFGMMSDVLLLPSSEGVYARKTITVPNGHGGKHVLELIVANRTVADIMEVAVKQHMNVKDIRGSGSTQ